MFEQLVHNFLRQEYDPKELIIILNKNDMNVEKLKKKIQNIKNIHLYQLDESITLGECLNFAVQKTAYDTIAKFDDDDYYSPNYLSNSLKRLDETGASVIGKSSIFVYFKKEQLLSLYREGYNNFYFRNKGHLKRALAGGTLIFKKKVIEKVQFSKVNLGEDVEFQKDCLNQNLSLYSGDVYDYALIRYENDHQHSWKVNNEKFQDHCKKIAITKSLDDYVLSDHLREGGHDFSSGMY